MMRTELSKGCVDNPIGGRVIESQNIHLFWYLLLSDLTVQRFQDDRQLGHGSVMVALESFMGLT